VNERYSKMYLVVGLGNPGSKYENTRHNVGFRVVELWSRKLGVPLTGRRFQSTFGWTKYQNKEVLVIRPLAFMNLSGKCVKAFVQAYRLDTVNVLVIHDDLDLAVGRVKVVSNGGAGGHRGVLSIMEALGSVQFPRVKIGIGRPKFGETVEDYVLEPFYGEQQDVMESVIQLAIHACELFISQGVESAMNQINCKNLSD